MKSIGLFNPKFNVNVGAALRASKCYGVDMLALTGIRYKRSSVDTTNSYNDIPLITCKNLKDVIPFDSVPVAVDLVPGAVNLIDYIHPKNAFYIFGPEDGTLGKQNLDWCRDKVYIPTNGCMNLAATVNVVLYDRLMKNHK